MNVLVSASREGFDNALKLAREVGATPSSPGGLAAPTNAAWQGKVEELWADIEAAFKNAFLFGRELAGDLIRKAVANTEQALKDAKAKAGELQEVLLNKLRAFQNVLVTEAISRIAFEYKVGERTLRLSGVSCKQKLIVAGSLTTNITELVSLVSTGELEVEAEYTFVPAATVATA